MNKFIVVLFFLVFSAATAVAQSQTSAASEPIPEGFKSDGCTLFPDGGYRDCCVAHDLDYFKGGTWRERLQSDNRLFKCVAGKKGWWHKLIAPVMWVGVRIGGVSFLPTPFRWGFGKTKIKKRCRSR